MKRAMLISCGHCGLSSNARPKAEALTGCQSLVTAELQLASRGPDCPVHSGDLPHFVAQWAAGSRLRPAITQAVTGRANGHPGSNDAEDRG